MKTTDFYKDLLRQAKDARSSIAKAEEKYRHGCSIEKEQLESGMLGQEGYDAYIAMHEQDRDREVNEALSRIDSVERSYGALMDEMGQLDGSKIDNDTMAILNSGMKLSSSDWQFLADRHRDNYVMSRILRERYEENPPKDLVDACDSEQPGAFIMVRDNRKEVEPVTFGQSPAERKEIFSRFAGLVRHTTATGTCMPGFASQESYWNHLARESIGKMQPFSDEDFGTVNEDFPVEYQGESVCVW